MQAQPDLVVAIIRQGFEFGALVSRKTFDFLEELVLAGTRKRTGFLGIESPGDI